MPEYEFVKVTWMRAAKVYWSLLWRGFLLWFFSTAVLGSILLIFMESAGAEAEAVMAACIILGYTLLVLAGIIVLKSVLGHDYSDFKLSLTAK